MKKRYGFIWFSLIISTVSSSTFSAPIRAVIGLQNSQIVEHGQQISLAHNPGTLFPLQEDFQPINYLQNKANKHWFDEIGKEVSVEHKQRELHYNGKLTKIDTSTGAFLLSTSTSKHPMRLPLSDFYLIPLEEKKPVNVFEAPYQISYQTNQLSWTPQLSLVFENNTVSLYQNAIIHNHSSSAIAIQESMLHYSRSTQPTAFKAERSLAVMDAAQPKIDYQDNEINYSIADEIMTIPPYSTSLYPLPSSHAQIEQKKQAATIYTHNNSTGRVDIPFFNTMTFTLSQDSLPGAYKTFWRRNQLLIPSNNITLNTVRANHPISVITNKSQDITGHITLLSTTSKKFPNTQTWEATIHNHSETEQNYGIDQNTNGILKVVNGEGVKPLNANGLTIIGKIKPLSTKTITYTIQLSN